MAWLGYDAALAADPAGVAAVLALAHVAGKHPLDARELAWAIERESGWNPQAMNPTTHATGLIQMMPATLKTLGAPPPNDFRQLSRMDQAPWVGQFFDLVKRSRINRAGDVYMAIAAPGFVAKPDAAVVYPANSQAWRDNPAWRPKSGGDITAGSIRAYGRPPLSGGPVDPASPLPPPKKGAPPTSPPTLPPKPKPPVSPPTSPPSSTPPTPKPPGTSPPAAINGLMILALLLVASEYV